jgi:CheY-like chemotaxis protein
VESVEIASDGAHGLKLIRQNMFDLVLLDLVLPVFSGIECLEELDRDRSTGAQVPVIFGMSNAAENEDIDLAYSHGMGAFFNKPIDVEDLCAVISHHFPHGATCTDACTQTDPIYAESVADSVPHSDSSATVHASAETRRVVKVRRRIRAVFDRLRRRRSSVQHSPSSHEDSRTCYRGQLCRC